MMMALAEIREKATILVYGGESHSLRQMGKMQGKLNPWVFVLHKAKSKKKKAEEILCRTCASGGGCQFLGTAATSQQVIGEALGLSLPHSALSPSGSSVWLELGTRSAHALRTLHKKKISTKEILTESALRNAMIIHAACGGSSNLIIHLSAIAYHAGLKRPTVSEWDEVNRLVPRLVDVLPNGPNGFSTAQFFLAGGVPELMLKLRELNLLDLEVLTCTGLKLGENLEAWEKSERRIKFRELLMKQDNVDPQDAHSFESTSNRERDDQYCMFPLGNLAPEGSVIKSTAIDDSVVDEDGVYRLTGPARVFTTEREAVRAVKGLSDKKVSPGEVIVLCGRGPMGAGMEEVGKSHWHSSIWNGANKLHS